LSIIHCYFYRAWFLVFACAFVFLTFPPSLYLCDLVFLFLLGSWLEFLLVYVCEFTRFRFCICFCLPLYFSWLDLSLFISPFKHLLYFHLSLSPFLSMSLCTSLSSTLFLSISLCVPMFVYLFESLYFYILLTLSRYVTVFITVSSTLIHSLSLCVSLTSIDSISPFLLFIQHFCPHFIFVILQCLSFPSIFPYPFLSVFGFSFLSLFVICC
jgi:hypothetical protein